MSPDVSKVSIIPFALQMYNISIIRDRVLEMYSNISKPRIYSFYSQTTVCKNIEIFIRYLFQKDIKRILFQAKRTIQIPPLCRLYAMTYFTRLRINRELSSRWMNEGVSSILPRDCDQTPSVFGITCPVTGAIMMLFNTPIHLYCRDIADQPSAFPRNHIAR